MKNTKQLPELTPTRFGYDVPILGRDREITWNRSDRALSVSDVSLDEAKELLVYLRMHGGITAAARSLPSSSPRVESPPTDPPELPRVKSRPVYKEDPVSPEDPAPTRSEELLSPEATDLKKELSEVLDNLGGVEGVDGAVAGTVTGLVQSLADKVASIPADKREALARMADSLNSTVDAFNTESDNKPKKSPVVESESEAKPDKKPSVGASVLDEYMEGGSRAKKKSPPKVVYSVGDEYRGMKIINAGIEEMSSGDTWCVTLEDGSSALINMEGVETNYIPSESPTDSGDLGITHNGGVAGNAAFHAVHSKVAADDASASVVDPAENTEVAEEKEPRPIVLLDADTPVPPEDILGSAKLTDTVSWLVENDSRHQPKCDSELLQAQVVQLHPHLKSLARTKATGRAKQRARTALANLGLT